jgi:hypothetical protein
MAAFDMDKKISENANNVTNNYFKKYFILEYRKSNIWELLALMRTRVFLENKDDMYYYFDEY